MGERAQSSTVPLRVASTVRPYPELIYGAIKKTGKSGFAALFMIAVLLLYGGRYAEALACGEHRSG